LSGTAILLPRNTPNFLIAVIPFPPIRPAEATLNRAEKLS
jgi:hypothetical protein